MGLAQFRQRENALRRRRASNAVRRKSISAPITGWNTRDDLDDMAPTDAVFLDNWFPDVGKVTMRKGNESHATGVGSGSVETLYEYCVGTNRQLLAASGSEIYNASVVGAATLLSAGFTNARWDTETFNGIGTFVNGADTPQSYNGTALSNMTWTGSGLTPSTLAGVNKFKNRLFYWTGVDQDFWYASINAISGTLTKFPLSRVGVFGGNLVSMQTWSLDAGSGLDDIAVFIMSTGHVILYQGTDPGDASAWALVGTYQIGSPIGIRAVIKFGGDVLVVTHQDAVLLSQVLNKGKIRTDKDDLSKISGAVRDAAKIHASKFGWQALVYPSGNMMLINVPMGAQTSHQYVVNTITGAWCRFKALNTLALGLYNNELYIGGIGDGVVYKADTGNADGGVGGSNIDADAQQAWTDLGRPGRKLMRLARPVVEADGLLTSSFGLGFDFVSTIDTTDGISGAAGAVWDVALWDVALWAPEDNIRLDWRAVSGEGYRVGARHRVQTKNQSVAWHATDYRFTDGVAL